jgi:hypothetical protein
MAARKRRIPLRNLGRLPNWTITGTYNARAFHTYGHGYVHAPVDDWLSSYRAAQTAGDAAMTTWRVNAARGIYVMPESVADAA